MKKNTLLIILLLFLIKTQSQSLDSINYVSKFEKQIFEETDSLRSKQSYFEYLFAIDSTTNLNYAKKIKKSIDDFIISLDINKINKYSKKKRIKYVFKNVHSQFLRKYEDVVNFSEIFKNGTYNCVSASAIYSYIFDSLSIPYQIKETPTHIYLIAYPNDANIYIETTIPGNNGFYSPSDSDIKKAVLELTNAKLITKNYVDQVGYKKAYMDFFYDKEYLEPIELVGIQYYNEGVNYFQNEEYEKAYYSFKKAEKFYATKKVKYLKISSLSLILAKSNFNKIKDIKYITTLLNSLEYQKDFLAKDLRYYSANIITANENNEEFLILSLKEFDSIKNSDVKDLLILDFYEYLANRRFRLDKNVDDILEYALKAYHIKKEDEELQNLIGKAILRHYSYTTPNKKSVQKIEDYSIKYPFLKQSRFYKKYMTWVYSYMISQSFHKEEPEFGSLYFDQLKILINTNKDKIELDEEVIGNAYWAVGAYYYGNSKLKKAKEILEEGKKLAPEHHKLNKVLSYVNEDLK